MHVRSPISLANVRIVSFGAACFFAGAVAASFPAAAQTNVVTPGAKPAPAKPTAEEAARGFVGAGVCADCHQDKVEELARTAHGRTERKTWEGATLCESCHGPGQEHAASEGDASKIRSFAKLPAPDVAAVCLTCHEKSEESHWKGSAHENRGLSCLSCHRIHHPAEVPKHLLAKGNEFDTCTACHMRRKASLYRSAHMPMREGNITCTSCHNPHGSAGPSLLRQFSINENCYTCHAEKRSPVLWEHPPVKEQCTTCHEPHGSLHPRLLVAKVPRLCQQCHDETRHPTQPYSDASAAPEFFPNSRMFDRGCLNCHSMIHGSNHPAGMRFLR
jgi:DmsE family decaheme c-type cytochrome